MAVELAIDASLLMGEIVVDFISEKVVDLLQLNFKVKAITDIEGKMDKLKDLSTIIDKVIQDLDSRPFIDDAVKDLLKKLKYLARDLEDVVDYYDTKVFQKQQRSNTSFGMVRDFFSSNNQLLFKSRVGVMIKAITKSLDYILLQKSFLHNLPQGSIRMSEPSLYDSLVTGRETERQMIVNMLTKDDDYDSNNVTLKVISIVGMGGLGKTTLAQFVYNDERVQDYFASLTMWKVVGAEFNPTKIIKSILELATGASVDISEIYLVKQKLKNELSGKRFLLVLDDVWNENESKWIALKTALTCGLRGSKILVTTRSQQVSKIMGSSNTTHQIQQLSRDDCLSLFYQFAFGDEVADQNLMNIGAKIVEKCGGVPLAAISLGSMLRGTREEAYWSSVLKSEISQLGNEEDKVLDVLKFSYDTLPVRSKKCFAFASLFPKNYWMTKDELIKLWIANGFVCSEGNFDAETNGNHVFNDLVMGSFFILAPSRDFEDDSYVTKCKMHDLMYDLARSVSANIYWNSKQDSVKDIGKRTYHLQLFPGELPNDIFSQLLNKKPLYLRTFISPRTFSCLSINLLEVFSELKFLRVLDLSYNGIKEVPTSIGNLIHLSISISVSIKNFKSYQNN
ncbi:putative disease resistance protein RGA4 [Zingiber officinale]|uniref:putative disease resistance protein RGA4 n=1 Tax=Zingiber officinale TaxID=94328 RepID=UPI001C4B5F09|nr:putative disease resistance protein RGA4 [Zingiber officinale]